MSEPRWKLGRGADGEIAVYHWVGLSFMRPRPSQAVLDVARLAAAEERARTFAEVLTRWREVSESLGEFEK